MKTEKLIEEYKTTDVEIKSEMYRLKFCIDNNDVTAPTVLDSLKENIDKQIKYLFVAIATEPSKFVKGITETDKNDSESKEFIEGMLFMLQKMKKKML